MISLHRMADKGHFREICFFLIFSFQILLDDPIFVRIFTLHVASSKYVVIRPYLTVSYEGFFLGSF